MWVSRPPDQVRTKGTGCKRCAVGTKYDAFSHNLTFGIMTQEFLSIWQTFICSGNICPIKNYRRCRGVHQRGHIVLPATFDDHLSTKHISRIIISPGSPRESSCWYLRRSISLFSGGSLARAINISSISCCFSSVFWCRELSFYYLHFTTIPIVSIYLDVIVFSIDHAVK